MVKNYFFLSVLICAFMMSQNLSAQDYYMRASDKIGYNTNEPGTPVLPEFIPSCEWLNEMKPTKEIRINTVPAKNGGTGTQSDPYIVSTAADLAEIATRVNAGTEATGTIFPNGNQGYADQYFLMSNDIDLSDYTPWMPISIPGAMIFYGHFDGGNHTITGLTTDFSTTESNQGLFSVIGMNSSLSNLTIKNSNISGAYYTGAFVGACAETSVISNCHNYCNVVSSSYYTGGIVGAGYGTIENCTNNGNHSGGDFVGGIAGDYYGTLTGCINTGDMIGNTSIGGIIGYSANVNMSNCINSGNITGFGGYNGGVVGFVTNYNSPNTTTNLLNMGNVICTSNSSAAVIGRLWQEGDAPSNASNCYYDRQLTHKMGIYPGGDVEGTAEPRYTHEMIGDGLENLLGLGWTIADGMYPSPEMVSASDIAIVACSPANFDYKSEEDFDHFDNLTADFQAFNNLDVVWSNDNVEVLSIDNNNLVTLMGLGTDTIFAQLGDAKKNIVVTVTDYLGTNDYQLDNQIGIYPNPAVDIVNFDSTEPMEITIVNINGQIVSHTSLNGNNQLNVSDLSSGVYFVKITTATAQTTKKLVVK